MSRKHQFVVAVTENVRPMAAIGRPEHILCVDTQKADYIAAAEYVYDAFINQDISNWTKSNFINFLQQAHAVLAKSLFARRSYIAGDFRDDELLVVRNNSQVEYAHSRFGPKSLGAMSLYMRDSGKFSQTVIKNFITGYHKYFHTLNRYPAHYDRARDAQNNLQKFAKDNFNIDISDDNFYDTDGNELQYTSDELKALNYIFRIHQDPKKFAESLDQLAEQTISNIKKLESKSSAIFYFEFCIIMPFWDGNGRFARLISNAIRAKLNQPVINLNTQIARKVYEYTIDLEQDPTQEKMIHLFMRFTPPKTTLHDIEDSLGDEFFTKYGASIKWQLKAEGLSFSARLTNKKIKSSQTKWFDKKLTEANIDYYWDEKSDGYVELVFTYVDEKSFPQQEQTQKGKAALVNTIGFKPNVDKPRAKLQDIKQCFGDAFFIRYDKINWKFDDAQGLDEVTLVGVTIKPGNKAWFEKKLSNTNIQYRWQANAKGNHILIFSNVDRDSFCENNASKPTCSNVR